MRIGGLNFKDFARRAMERLMTNGAMSAYSLTVSKGRRIEGKEEAKVKAFYESDSVSRVCPGRKD